MEIDEAKRQLILDYQKMFNTDEGKRILTDLESWYDGRIIPQGMPDVTAFQLGQRDAFLYIVDKVNADPDAERQETTNE